MDKECSLWKLSQLPRGSQGSSQNGNARTGSDSAPHQQHSLLGNYFQSRIQYSANQVKYRDRKRNFQTPTRTQKMRAKQDTGQCHRGHSCLLIPPSSFLTEVILSFPRQPMGLKGLTHIQLEWRGHAWSKRNPSHLLVIGSEWVCESPRQVRYLVP